MPKMKSNRGAAKTFRKTASGKFKRARSYKKHILTKKSSKRIRHLRHTTLVSKSDQNRVKRMLIV